MEGEGDREKKRRGPRKEGLGGWKMYGWLSSWEGGWGEKGGIGTRENGKKVVRIVGLPPPSACTRSK